VLRAGSMTGKGVVNRDQKGSGVGGNLTFEVTWGGVNGQSEVWGMKKALPGGGGSV
jgi:hypothetical protein